MTQARTTNGTATEGARFLALSPFKLSATSLTVEREPTRAELAQQFGILRTVKESIHWWIGDLANLFEDIYGEDWAQEIDAMLGDAFEAQTIANDKWVASRVRQAIRRGRPLYWNHHALIARFDEAAQVAWLARAELGDDGRAWSVDKLRREVKAQDAGAPAGFADLDHYLTQATDALKAAARLAVIDGIDVAPRLLWVAYSSLEIAVRYWDRGIARAALRAVELALETSHNGGIANEKRQELAV